MKLRKEEKFRKTQSHFDASVIRSCPQYDHAINKVTNPGQTLQFSASELIPNNDDDDDDNPNKTTQYKTEE